MPTIQLAPQSQPLQGSSEWLEQRLGKVTASEVAKCMDFMKNGKESAARRNYRENMVGERFTGVSANPDSYVSYDMKWGSVNERMAKAFYQMRTKTIIEVAPFVQHPTLMCGASPDGYIGKDGLAEIKCLRSANHLYKAIKTQEVPEDHLPQVHMQLWITQRKWCDFIAYDSRLPEGLKIFVQRVHYDKEYVAELEKGVRQFLDEVDADIKFFKEFIRLALAKQGRPDGV